MVTFDVSSIGFYVLDILGRPVSRIPPGGRADFIEEITMTVAGTAGGTAVDCALLGLRTRAVTTVGADDMGDFIVAKMERFGIDCALVRRAPGTPTSSTILPVRPNGERPALHVPGTAAVFTLAPADLDAALDARVVHMGGTGLLKAFDGEPTVRLLREAKARGRITTFDLIQASPETVALVTPCLPYIDYFVPSIDEAREMAGVEEPAAIARFFKSRGVRNCVITLAADGVFVSPEAGGDFHVSAFDVQVSDTTGCGDSFTAGIITGIIKGWDLEFASRFANAVAAKVAMGLGSVGRLVSLEDTMAAMNAMAVRRT
ncbi:MAG: carbohydrate kinase family protein [Parvibaculaceae bacterium]